MAKNPIKPVSINISEDPGLQYLNQKPETFNLPGQIIANNARVYEQLVTQVVTNVINVAMPNGANNEVQFNSGGELSGDTGFSYDASSDTLTVAHINANSISLGHVSATHLLGGSNGYALKTDGTGNLSFDAIFPSVSGQSGKVLKTDGISQVWGTVSYNDLTNTPSFATQTYVNNAIGDLINGAPAALNTLNELATALGNNDSYASTITTALSDKANSSDLSDVAFSGSYNDLSDTPTIPSLTGLATETYVTTRGYLTSSDVATTLSSYASKTYVSEQGFITSSTLTNGGYLTTGALSGYALSTDIPTDVNQLADEDGLLSTPEVITILGDTTDLVTEANSLTNQLSTLNNQIGSKNGEIGSKQSEISYYQSIISQGSGPFNPGYGSAIDSLNTAQGELSVLQGEYSSLQGQYSSITGQLNVLSNKIANPTGSISYDVGNISFELSSGIKFPDGTIQNTAGTTDYNDLSNKPIISDTTGLTGGDFFIAKDETTISLGQWAAQAITIGSSGIQIAGTGGVEIVGVAGAGITLGGETSGTITFNSTTSGIDYSDLSNTPTIPADISDLTDTTSLLGQGGGASTGNITFSDTTLTSSNGNVTIHFSPTASPAVEFNFAESGEFTAGEVNTRIVRSPSQIMSLINTDGVGVRIDSFNQPTSIDIGNTSTWDFVRLQYGAGSVTGNDGDVEIRSTPMGSPAEPSSISISPQGGENGSFTFGGDGSLNLPTNLKIAQLSAYGPSSGTMMIQAPNESMHIVTPGNDSHLTLGWSSTNSLETAMLSINADSDSLKAVKITTGNNATTLHGWVFGSDGTLTVPGSITKGDNLTLNSIGTESGYVAAVVADGVAGRVFVRTLGAEDAILQTWEFNKEGKLILPLGGDIVDIAGQTVLGGGASTGNITFIGDNIESSNNIVNVSASDFAQLESTDGSNTTQIWTELNEAAIQVNGTTWRFNAPTVAGSSSNAFEFPNGIMQRSGDQVNCVAGVDTVIYTSALEYNHTIKLLLNIEGVEDGQTDTDTQSCEMIVAKGFRANSVAGSAYGLVYTSANPLVTLSTRWNAVDSRVEITCRPVSATNAVNVRSTGIEVAGSGAG